MWNITKLHVDSDLSEAQKKWAADILWRIQNTADPRTFSDRNKGFVEALEDHSKRGGENLYGFYRFKPEAKWRYGGYNIRIIFSIFVNGVRVYPKDRIFKGKKGMIIERIANRENAYLQVVRIELEAS